MSISRKEMKELGPVKEEFKTKAQEKKEYMVECNAEYSKKHAEERKEYMKEYHKTHAEETREYGKERRKTPEGKMSDAKEHARRKRNLGFIPLNESFPGSHYHHIDSECVIAIPEELHRSIYHNQVTGQGMEEMNDLAMKFFIQGLRG